MVGFSPLLVAFAYALSRGAQVASVGSVAAASPVAEPVAAAAAPATDSGAEPIIITAPVAVAEAEPAPVTAGPAATTFSTAAPAAAAIPTDGAPPTATTSSTAAPAAAAIPTDGAPPAATTSSTAAPAAAAIPADAAPAALDVTKEMVVAVIKEFDECRSKRLLSLKASAGGRRVVALYDPRYPPTDEFKADMLARGGVEAYPQATPPKTPGWIVFDQSSHSSGGSKARMLTWLGTVCAADPKCSDYTYLWHVEDDVFWSGRWSELFDKYAHESTDILSGITQFKFYDTFDLALQENNIRCDNAGACGNLTNIPCQLNFPAETEEDKQSCVLQTSDVLGKLGLNWYETQKYSKIPLVHPKAFWMAIRISKRFADLLYDKVNAAQFPGTEAARTGTPGVVGHHEVMTLALCYTTDWCTVYMDQHSKQSVARRVIAQAQRLFLTSGVLDYELTEVNTTFRPTGDKGSGLSSDDKTEHPEHFTLQGLADYFGDGLGGHTIRTKALYHPVKCEMGPEAGDLSFQYNGVDRQEPGIASVLARFQQSTVDQLQLGALPGAATNGTKELDEDYDEETTKRRATSFATLTYERPLKKEVHALQRP